MKLLDWCFDGPCLDRYRIIGVLDSGLVTSGCAFRVRSAFWGARSGMRVRPKWCRIDPKPDCRSAAGSASSPFASVRMHACFRAFRGTFFLDARSEVRSVCV